MVIEVSGKYVKGHLLNPYPNSDTQGINENYYLGIWDFGFLLLMCYNSI
jgi:hypothetical protein